MSNYDASKLPAAAISASDPDYLQKLAIAASDPDGTTVELPDYSGLDQVQLVGELSKKTPEGCRVVFVSKTEEVAAEMRLEEKAFEHAKDKLNVNSPVLDAMSPYETMALRANTPEGNVVVGYRITFNYLRTNRR